jgi:hypothetical protein
VSEHVLADNATASMAQCKAVWASHRGHLEARLAACTSLDELNTDVAARRQAMRAAMVGPYRDTADMADEVSSWVQAAITSLGHRLGMEQARVDAECVGGLG